MKYLLLPLSTFLFLACSSGPQPISYGTDACGYCRMTIVDKQHAAQLVIHTGKAFSYDAIECMMNDLKEWEHPEVSHYLVANYDNTSALTDAQKASYLICKEIPSPMGRNLTAFEKVTKRDEIKNKYSGEALNWAELKLLFEIN